MKYIKFDEALLAKTLEDIKEKLTGIQSMTTMANVTISTACEGDKATLIFTETAYNKIQALVETCTTEVGWHCVVTRSNKTANMFTVKDVVVYPQTVTGVTVQTDDLGYANWAMELPDAVFNSMRMQGHSHVNMNTNPSGVDTTYQNDLLAQVKDFYAFSIHNKAGNMWCAIYDVENNIMYESTDIIVITPKTGAKVWADEAIEKHVHKPVAVTAPAQSNKDYFGVRAIKSDIDETQSIEEKDAAVGAFLLKHGRNPYGMEWNVVRNCWGFPNTNDCAEYGLTLDDPEVFSTSGYNRFGGSRIGARKINNDTYNQIVSEISKESKKDTRLNKATQTTGKPGKTVKGKPGRPTNKSLADRRKAGK